MNNQITFYPWCGVLPPSIGCPPNAAAQAQFPTLSCTIPVVCQITAIAGCSGAQAQTIGVTGWNTCGQPSTVTTTVQPTTHLTLVPGSCGVFPPSVGCPPNAAAQAQFPTLSCTIPVVCQITAIAGCSGAQAQTIGVTGWQSCGQPSTVTTTVQPTTHFTVVPGSCGVGHTGWLTCGQPSTVTTTVQPTHPGSCYGPTGTQGCTSALGCPSTSTCPPNTTAQVGNTGWLTCGQGSTVTTTVQPTHVSPCVGPTGTQGCTSALGCPSTSTCPPNTTAQAQFPTLSCTIIPIACVVTAVAHCSGAQAQTIGVTGWQTCGQPSTVTTTVQPTHPGSCYGPTGTQGCTSGFGCPSTSTCPPNTNAQAQFPTLSCTIPVVCAATQIIGCGGSGFPTQHCTGIPVIC